MLGFEQVHLSHKFMASVLWIDAVDSGYSVSVGDHGVTNMLVQCLTAWTIVEKERCQEELQFQM